MVTGPRTDSYRINFGIQKDSPHIPPAWPSRRADPRFDVRTHARARALPPAGHLRYTLCAVHRPHRFGFFFFFFLHTVRPWGKSRFGRGFFIFLHVSRKQRYNKSRGRFYRRRRVRSPRSVVAGGPSRHFRPSLIFTDVFSRTIINVKIENRTVNDRSGGKKLYEIRSGR